MLCNDFLVVRWNVGVGLAYSKKKFVRYSKDIPKMLVKVNLGDCDLDGNTLRAYYTSPNSGTEVILDTVQIVGGEAIFDLEGLVCYDYGEWKVEFVLATAEGGNTGTTGEVVKYFIIENIEGNNTDVIVGETTEKTVGELIALLEESIVNAQNEAEIATEVNETLEATITVAIKKNGVLVSATTAANDKNTELLETTSLANKKNNKVLQTTALAEEKKQELIEELNKVDPNILNLQNKIDEVPDQIQAIEDKGIEQIAIVGEKGDTEVLRVGNTGNSEVTKVAAEGNTQVALVETKGSEVKAEVEAILENSEAVGNALSLSGKTRAEFDAEINKNYSHFVTGGYQIITDVTQDIELKEGYYEIVDNENNQYSIRVNSDLFIKDGKVIENVAGYVRLRGVKVPCKLAIRQFPTLTNNTTGNFLEMNSNFPSSEAVKSLIKEVN